MKTVWVYSIVTVILAVVLWFAVGAFFARFDGIAGAGDQGGRPSNSLRHHNSQ